MALLLDHIFIITQPEANEAARLSELGLIEGKANVHPGQGTANKRFFLNEFTIELLYVSNENEAANGAGKELGILARAGDAGACPFGIVVRTSDNEAIPDFPSWQYFPDYFSDDMCFFVGKNSNQVAEPLCICMPPTLPKQPRVPSEFSNPGWMLTALDIHLPVKIPSETLKHFADIQHVHIEFGKPYNMRMQFNRGVAERVVSLQPDLPLTLEW